MSIVREKVYPIRMKVNREAHRKYWWHYGDKRPALYRTIANLKRVLVHPLTSKHHGFVFYSPNIIFSHMTIVVALDGWEHYSLLQSEIHWQWALQYGNKLETRPQYTNSDVFETFAFPKKLDGLKEIGEAYYEHRRQIMLARQEGLTTTYNRFHNPEENAKDIVRLRELHVEMDTCVASAYGWDDLSLGHDFHETAQGVRYTVSESARREILSRLLKLNHERWDEEQKQMMNDEGGRMKGSKGKKGKRGTSKSSDGQMGLL